MNRTKIEFAHTTVNPIVGCSPVSPGCDHCYAARMAHYRLGKNPATPQYAGMTTLTEAGPKWTGAMRSLGPKHMMAAKAELERAKARKRVFLCSMSDLYHRLVPPETRLDVYGILPWRLPRHAFIVITKRSGRMNAEMLEFGKRRVLDNVMLMATCENMEMLLQRAQYMRELAAVGWHTGLILEPMLEPMTLQDVLYDLGGVRNEWSPWVVCGMEQGPGRRTLCTDAARQIAHECAVAGIPFFFKKDSGGGCPADLPRQFPAWMDF